MQTSKVSYAFGRNVLGHQAEANLPKLGEKPQRAQYGAGAVERAVLYFRMERGTSLDTL